MKTMFNRKLPFLFGSLGLLLATTYLGSHYLTTPQHTVATYNVWGIGTNPLAYREVIESMAQSKEGATAAAARKMCAMDDYLAKEKRTIASLLPDARPLATVIDRCQEALGIHKTHDAVAAYAQKLYNQRGQEVLQDILSRERTTAMHQRYYGKEAPTPGKYLLKMGATRLSITCFTPALVDYLRAHPTLDPQEYAIAWAASVKPYLPRLREAVSKEDPTTARMTILEHQLYTAFLVDLYWLQTLYEQGLVEDYITFCQAWECSSLGNEALRHAALHKMITTSGATIVCLQETDSALVRHLVAQGFTFIEDTYHRLPEEGVTDMGVVILYHLPKRQAAAMVAQAVPFTFTPEEVKEYVMAHKDEDTPPCPFRKAIRVASEKVMIHLFPGPNKQVLAIVSFHADGKGLNTRMILRMVHWKLAKCYPGYERVVVIGGDGNTTHRKVTKIQKLPVNLVTALITAYGWQIVHVVDSKGDPSTTCKTGTYMQMQGDKAGKEAIGQSDLIIVPDYLAVHATSMGPHGPSICNPSDHRWIAVTLPLALFPPNTWDGNLALWAFLLFILLLGCGYYLQRRRKR